MLDNNMKSNEIIDKDWLENFLYFLEVDIKSLDESEFITMLAKYSKFVCYREFAYDFLDFRKKYDSYMDGLLEQADSGELSQGKAFFVEIQSHLRNRLAKIIEMTGSNTNGAQKDLFTMGGNRKLMIAPNGDRFIEGFWPAKIADSNELDLENEKKLADLALLDLIQQLRLNPKHFGVCSRRTCNNFYYQFTQKERKYCSNKCATADRQQRFQSEQKGKEKKPKKSRKT
jgi:hypothetical protein